MAPTQSAQQTSTIEESKIGEKSNKNFNSAYQDLVKQILYQGLDPTSVNRGAQVLVPTDDYILALEQPKADLSRIQDDIKARRQRQQMREQIAKEEREVKELEGCTFAPILYKKKQTKGKEVTQDGYDDEEPEETPSRDINQFLEDQRRFDDERKMKALQR